MWKRIYFRRETSNSKGDRLSMIVIKLLELSEINRLNTDISKIPKSEGIYFIFDKDDYVIYIGCSINLKSRLMTHLHIKNKVTSPIENKEEIYKISILLKSDYIYDTESIEQIYIDLYKPRYNSNVDMNEKRKLTKRMRKDKKEDEAQKKYIKDMREFVNSRGSK